MADRKEIRVFVSSPGDCAAERDAVSRVLDELNRTVGDREQLFFNALRWEDFPPGLGNGPQAVIDEQLGDYNILIGIMWMRFGTPIPGGGGSGTEHEVRQAIESWKRIGRPRVMFYFKDDPPTQLSTIDTAQLSEVLKFKNSLQSEGLTHSFLGTGNFESHLRVHLHSVIAQLRPSAVAVRPTSNLLPMEPYKDFHTKFREVIAAQRLPEVGAVLHVVFGSLADIRKIPPVIPVGQAFDFRQRGPRSVLASFESISVEGRPFFEAVETRWPLGERPKAAGLGHTKYVALPANTQDLPGAGFVVTTRDLSASATHYGRYVNTPIEGIDYIIDQVTRMADEHRLATFAMPLLGTGYANIQRANEHGQLSLLLKAHCNFAHDAKTSVLSSTCNVCRKASSNCDLLHPSAGARGTSALDDRDAIRWLRSEQRTAQIQELIAEAARCV